MSMAAQIPIPLSSSQILDMSFLENRARLLEIAAFLDRIDRASDADAGKSDFRYQAFINGLKLLLDDAASVRTHAIQMSLSDPTREPIADALGLRAHGAWKRGENEDH